MDEIILEMLYNCVLFNGMEKQDIRKTLEGIEYKILIYNKDDIFTLADEPIMHVDIVLSGLVISKMTSQSGKEVPIGRLPAGQIIAPAFVFSDHNRYPVNIRAGAYTEIFRMSKTSLEHLIGSNEKIRMNFIKTISNRALFLSNKIRSLGLSSVRENVKSFLLNESMLQKSNTIRLQKSRKEIAESFGIQKYSLIRMLANLEKEGSIKIEGKTITILDMNVLND